MRIISGSRRGKKLNFLPDSEVKPLQDRIKESLFSMIQFSLPGSIVLDCYAGTGSFGLEALSRGAEQAVFVERDGRGAGVLKSNIRDTGFSDSSEVCREDVFSFLMKTGTPDGHRTFDIIFMDPPFKDVFSGAFQNNLDKHAGHVESMLSNDGILILRYPRKSEYREEVGERLALYREKRFGRSRILLFSFKSE